MAKGKCPVCGSLGFLQILNNGGYARIRHYDRMENGKPQFHYHQIALEDANKILALDREVNGSSLINRSMNPMTKTIITNDPEIKDLALEPENKGAGRLAWLGRWLYEP